MSFPNEPERMMERPRQPALSEMPKTECACETCTSGCSRTPGWFLPGEAEATAKLLGIDLPELFARFLVAEFWIGEDENILTLSPRKLGQDGGRKATYGEGFSRGVCVFFENGSCRIHAAKPFECSRTTHEMQRNFRNLIAAEWDHDAHQDQVLRLLRRESE